MELLLDKRLLLRYKSKAQQSRVLTEGWVGNNAFCLNCGNAEIVQYENNKPVADFYCPSCREDYELKSKRNRLEKKIVDGAYKTMIERLQSPENPNLFLLNYNPITYEVFNFLIIPKHFFVPEIIEKRKPLAASARRAGWVGCNILLQNIPTSGRIFLVRNHKVEHKASVLRNWKRTLFLREEWESSSKGWLLDVMRCVEKIGRREFVLSDIYAFESELEILHPSNKHIRDKIRQQLQILRDKGYLDFVSRGNYRIT
jgi:type II restriction enzyme